MSYLPLRRFVENRRVVGEPAEFYSPETALWRALLLRLIEDAEGPDCLERDQARRWFGSRDFYLVCDYASVHPPQVLERVAHVLR